MAEIIPEAHTSTTDILSHTIKGLYKNSNR